MGKLRTILLYLMAIAQYSPGAALEERGPVTSSASLDTSLSGIDLTQELPKLKITQLSRDEIQAAQSKRIPSSSIFFDTFCNEFVPNDQQPCRLPPACAPLAGILSDSISSSESTCFDAECQPDPNASHVQAYVGLCELNPSDPSKARAAAEKEFALLQEQTRRVGNPSDPVAHQNFFETAWWTAQRLFFRFANDANAMIEIQNVFLNNTGGQVNFMPTLFNERFPSAGANNKRSYSLFLADKRHQRFFREVINSQNSHSI